MNSIEVFSGIGGLGLGISISGFVNLLALERDSKCCFVLNQNKGIATKFDYGHLVVNEDINKIHFNEYFGKVDLVVGGPPCQPFSLGGNHLGKSDVRNLFPEMIRVVRQVLPKAFLIENVKGLTRIGFSEYFEYIRLQLSFPLENKIEEESWYDHKRRLEAKFSSIHEYGCSYNVLYNVVNAADYGVPQKRERVFIVGFRNDVDANWSLPSPSHSKESLLWSKLTGEYWDKHSIPKKDRFFSKSQKKSAEKLSGEPSLLPWNTIRSALEGLPDPYHNNLTSNTVKNHEFKMGARAYKGHTGSHIDEPSKTIKAGSHGVPGGENMLLMHDGSVRYLTVREAARIQTFPDNFVFSGSWGESMKQLGNAVPIRLAEEIGASIRIALQKSVKS